MGEPQVPTTFERSGRPARRRLTFIGSQSPNQTKKHLFRCLFCLAGGNTLDRVGVKQYGEIIPYELVFEILDPKPPQH